MSASSMSSSRRSSAQKREAESEADDTQRKSNQEPTEAAEGRRSSARGEAKKAARDISMNKIPKPPAEWDWPADGDAIEVEVADDFGVTKWEKAKVTAVLTDGYFQAKITTKTDSWEDWFTWQEENKDWRRKRAPEPKPPAPRPAASSKQESKRQPEKRAPPASSSGGSSSSKRERNSSGADMLRLDYSKMRLRVDHAKREASLVPSASVSSHHSPLPGCA